MVELILKIHLLLGTPLKLLKTVAIGRELCLDTDSQLFAI
jgi:hypothetical protein